MNIQSLRLCRLLLIAILAWFIVACQSAATLSIAVRSGDTVIVGLSGEAEALVSNTTAEVIRAEDLNATITDVSGTTVAVQVRSVFRVYGDPTASTLAANKGQWIAVIDFVDQASNALQLDAGAATLRVNSSKLINPLQVSTTILAGTGEPHPLLGAENTFEKLAFLRPQLQALVSISGDLDDKLVGAVQYEFSVPQEPIPTPFGTLSAIDSVKLPGRRDVSYQSWVEPNPGGGTDLTVVMTAPAGIAASELYSFDLALVAGAVNRAQEPATYFSGSLQRAVFYDVDGLELTELQADIGLVE